MTGESITILGTVNTVGNYSLYFNKLVISFDAILGHESHRVATRCKIADEKVVLNGEEGESGAEGDFHGLGQLILKMWVRIDCLRWNSMKITAYLGLLRSHASGWTGNSRDHIYSECSCNLYADK